MMENSWLVTSLSPISGITSETWRIGGLRPGEEQYRFRFNYGEGQAVETDWLNTPVRGIPSQVDLVFPRPGNELVSTVNVTVENPFGERVSSASIVLLAQSGFNGNTLLRVDGQVQYPSSIDAFSLSSVNTERVLTDNRGMASLVTHEPGHFSLVVEAQNYPPTIVNLGYLDLGIDRGGVVVRLPLPASILLVVEVEDDEIDASLGYSVLVRGPSISEQVPLSEFRRTELGNFEYLFTQLEQGNYIFQLSFSFKQKMETDLRNTRLKIAESEGEANPGAQSTVLIDLKGENFGISRHGQLVFDIQGFPNCVWVGRVWSDQVEDYVRTFFFDENNLFSIHGLPNEAGYVIAVGLLQDEEGMAFAWELIDAQNSSGESKNIEITQGGRKVVLQPPEGKRKFHGEKVRVTALELLDNSFTKGFSSKPLPRFRYVEPIFLWGLPVGKYQAVGTGGHLWKWEVPSEGFPAEGLSVFPEVIDESVTPSERG